jgi:multidrug efflux system outer membrane protein
MPARASILPTIACASLMSGCAPLPTLAVAPEILSTEWSLPLSAADEAAPAAWTAFGSSSLAQLIAEARDRNADLGAARERIAAARAALRIVRSARLPAGSASAGLSATRSDNVGGPKFNYSDGFASVDTSYEVDLFGRLKASNRAARARWQASAFDRDAMSLAVEAQVSRAFVALAALAERAELLKQGLVIARERQRVIEVRVREGADTAVAAGINAVEIGRLEAELSRLAEAQAISRNALAVLVGREAPLFRPEIPPLAALRLPPVALPQPPALIVRRPDLRAAESRITAGRGDVAAVRAAFLPQMRLTAGALVQAATLSGPFGATLSAGSGLAAPLFDRARLQGNLDAAAAGQREAVELFRATLLNALREVEDALKAGQSARARLALLAEAGARARETARLARIQYLEGVADFQILFEAERALLDIQDQALVSREQILDADIALFAAIGGDPETAPAGPLELR